MNSHTASGTTVVIGLGNPLMGDDGIGLAILSRFCEAYVVPDDIQVIDGGTWGMNLLPTIDDAARIVLLDAIDVGAGPGTPVRLEGDAVPRHFAVKLSPHQIDIREVLAASELRGRLSADLVAIGMQPGPIAMGTFLTRDAQDGLEAAAAAVAAQLLRWGIACETREMAGCTN